MASSSSAIAARRDDALRPRITAARPLPGVRAGSALVRVGRRLLAIQDDAFAAMWIDPIARQLEMLRLHGGGQALAKGLKPDFEAAFVHEDRIWIFGSGSRPNRCSFARVDLATGETPLFNALPLFAAVTRAAGRQANVEGAVAAGDRLRLFQRGGGRAAGGNCILEFPIAVLAGAAPELLSLRHCDLGEAGGAHLGFTDAVAMPDGRVLYLAVAEDTPDAVADGAIAGCAVGVIDPGQGAGAAARWAPLLEADGTPSRRKVEGVALDPGGKSGWLLTDPDDPKLPAELCRFEFAA